MAKHFITVDENNVVMRGFSDDFEQPSANDICINADGGRQFEIEGVINPPMRDGLGAPLYKAVGGKIQERTETEKSTDTMPVIQTVTIEERLQAVEQLVKGTPSYGELLEAVNLLLEA